MTWPSRALADPPEDYHAALQDMPPPTREVRMMDSIAEKKKSLWKHSDLNVACHNQMCKVNHPVFAGVCIGCGHWVRKADVPGYDTKPRGSPRAGPRGRDSATSSCRVDGVQWCLLWGLPCLQLLPRYLHRPKAGECVGLGPGVDRVVSPGPLAAGLGCVWGAKSKR